MRWSRGRTASVILLFIFFCLFWNKDGFKQVANYYSKKQKAENFLLRPVLSYDESVKLNSERCPEEGINIDAGNVKDSEQKWRDIPSTQITDWRHDIAAYLDLKRMQEHEIKYSGLPIVKNEQTLRGIVMAAGDNDAVIRAAVNIRFLRAYNCTLPVEIFHYSDELSRSNQIFLSELSQLHSADGHDPSDMKVSVRVVEGLQKTYGWKAYQIKGFAIQQSSFDEILYLDTDSYLLRNPESLFHSKQWKETGLMLWPDFTKSHPTNPIWRLVGLQCRNEYEGESGQLVISRSRHQDVLWVAEYFALHHDEFYGFMGGDRDSFRAAALLLGKKWSGPGRLNAAAGVLQEGSSKGHTMLQSDPEGRWMFVHANLIKHGKFPRPLWKRIQRVAKDKYKGSSTYGSVDPPNDMLGEGVKVHVYQEPKLMTTMEPFAGYDEKLIVVEEWDSYEELRGFEEKWFSFGGVH